jgi:hypothetical protein
MRARLPPRAVPTSIDRTGLNALKTPSNAARSPGDICQSCRAKMSIARV